MMELNSRIGVVGDVHKKTSPMMCALDTFNDKGIKHVVQVGDFAMYENPKGLGMVSNRAYQLGMEVWFIPGNHENFPMLMDIEDNPSLLPGNIHYLPKGSELTIGDKTAIAVGGAVSVNKKFLREGVDWFPEEEISFMEMFQIMESDPVDIMLSHDCPSQISLPVDCFSTHARKEFGHDILLRAMEHRGKLGEITNALQPQVVIHGHYHHGYQATGVHDGGEFVSYGLDKEMNRGALAIFDSESMNCDMLLSEPLLEGALL